MRVADLIPTVTGAYPKDFLELVDILSHNGKAPGDKVTEVLWPAYQFSKEHHEGQRRKSGRPFFEHCYEVAHFLAHWQMDLTTVTGGILHDSLEDTDATYDDIAAEFGHEVAELVEGVTKLGDVQFLTREQKRAENFMKMLLSMAKDVRVIIIKFADRLHNMRTLEYLPLIKQRRTAIETRDVYSPLAHRLGMYMVKREFDDLVFKALEPDDYKATEKKLRSTVSNRQKFMKQVTAPIEEGLEKHGIKYRTTGRLKSFASINKKMAERGTVLEEIYDIFAIRIIVESVADCYSVLGIVHQLYTPVHERFKDFVATPKINGYQSLHTTAVGPGGRMVEIQIRTEEMDQTAEIGVAAHWKYKESVKEDSDLDRHVEWLRNLVSILHDESSDPREFMNLLQIDLYQDEVFVFTPAGDLVQLPSQCTPIDFAYDVHTEVGHHCLSAKVDGRIVPLNTNLKSGQTVEIITSDSQKPNYAWLKFVRTSKARTAILRWHRKAQREVSLKLGKEILEKSLRRLKLSSLAKEIKNSPGKLGYNDEEKMLVALGTGQTTVRDILRKVSPDVTDEQIERAKEEPDSFLQFARRSAKGVRVHGIDNILVTFGKCCNPIPGDEIIGFVTQGKGITIHRVECKNLPIMSESFDRFLEVEWDVDRKAEFLARVKVEAQDRKGYLKDLTEAISRLNINITSVDVKVDEGLATCILVVALPNLRRLKMALRRMKDINGTIYAERET
ncbi:MAG: bifunctional (p)ppGpp synthetase/guanosine-3',5'-bis(diphosphate) 3'-pyrophosphohydrolase [Candidatus Neomarinimicrobiota bacterium]